MKRFCPVELGWPGNRPGQLIALLIVATWAPCLAPASLRAQEVAPETAAALQNPAVQTQALALARSSLAGWLATGRLPPLPDRLAPVLRERGAVIVTLEVPGQVAPRGCRGTLEPAYDSLALEIAHNAVAAATRDDRVAPLRAQELAECRISLTVILRLRPIPSLAQHDPANDGLIARSGDRVGIVLPYEGHDSATQWLWAKRKAGLADEAPAAMFELEAVRFKES